MLKADVSIWKQCSAFLASMWLLAVTNNLCKQQNSQSEIVVVDNHNFFVRDIEFD